MLIALDSSTAWCGVALYDQARGELLEERSWRSGTDHCRQLLPEIDAATRAHSLTARDLTAVAVALGPGTFNGVRVAVATAKLLAQSLAIPVVGIGTLELYVQPWRGSDLLVRPILSAARGELGTGLWRAGASLKQIESVRLASTNDIFVPPDEPTLFAGELEPAWRDAIAQLGPNARVATAAQSTRRAAALVELAAERLSAGSFDSVAELTPVYLRPPHITKPRR